MGFSLKNSDSVLKNVTDYWDNRAFDYSNINKRELNSIKRDVWQNLLTSHAPRRKKLRVLDIGTGPGFFAIIMAQIGHKVTAVDATISMLKQAEDNAKQSGVTVDFVKSDVHFLPFEDDNFDLIVTRNVTWNLKKPEQAYAEWHRVLKPGGCLINFDANWYLHLFDQTFKDGFIRDRENTDRLKIPDHYKSTDTTTMNKIAEGLPLSRKIRPQWDVSRLLDIGFSQCTVDTKISEKVLDEEEKINYRSTPMFMIVAEK